MGLDIYLYRYDNFADTREREKKHSEFDEGLWAEAGEYDSLSEEKKAEIRQKSKEVAKSLGLDDWGIDNTGAEQIELPHPSYPDHYFKIGYFRSSYNSGGIERILRNFSLMTLRDIFEVNKEEYYIQPDWARAKERALETLEKFKALPNYRVEPFFVTAYSKDVPTSPEEAMNVFLKEMQKLEETRKKHPDREECNYSNGVGYFYPAEELKVHAIIPGKSQYIFNERECLYVILEGANDWYINALEIVVATCDHVLAQKNIEQYYLHWSG